MKKFIILLIFIPLAHATNPVKKSDYSPNIDTPMIPGSRVPLENMNTAPTEPQLEEDNAKMRNVTEKNRSKVPMEIPKTPKEKQSQVTE